MKKLLCLLLFVSLIFNIKATSYFVDYTNGVDTANGISTSTPWQHCPGDPSATSNPSTATLNAGDVVNFKGGVTYLLTAINPNPTYTYNSVQSNWIVSASIPGIALNWNGTLNNPITYDGNTSGAWGVGKAIITDNFSTNNINAFFSTGIISNINFLSLVFTNIGGSNYFPMTNYFPEGFPPKPGGGIGAFGGINLIISNCYFGELGYYQEFPTNMANGSLLGGAIGFSGVTNLTITNCEFTQMRDPLYFQLNSVIQVNIGHCYFHDQMEWGLTMALGGNTNAYRSNVFIHDCTWSNTDQYYAGVEDNGDGTSTRIGPWMGYTIDMYPDGSPKSSGGPHQNSIMMFNGEGCNGNCALDRHPDTNVFIYNNKFITSKTNSGGTTAVWFQDSTSVNLYNNLFYRCAANNAISVSEMSTNTPLSIKIYNNTIFMSSVALNIVESGYTNMGAFMDVRNNIISTLNTGNNNAYDYELQSDSFTFTNKMTNNLILNYNCYFSDQILGNLTVNGLQPTYPVSFTKPAANQFGWDLNSVSDEGLIQFIAPANLFPYNFDLHLLANSPAIGEGTNLTALGFPGLNNDLDGNPRPTTGNWDIGAYNFIPMLRTKIKPVTTFNGSLPPDPTTISGCKLYLNASLIKGMIDLAPVTNWVDMSGNGNNAVQYKFSGVLRPVPTYRINMINGLPTVHFDGQFQFLSNSYPILGGASTMVLVAKKNITGANYVNVVNARPPNTTLYNVILTASTAGDLWATYMENPKASSYSDNTWRLMVSVSDGNTSSPQNTLYTDNNVGEVVTDFGRYNGDVGNQMAIGCDDSQTSPSTFFSGDIYAIIIYNRALTSGEVTTLYNFFHYYGII